MCVFLLISCDIKKANSYVVSYPKSFFTTAQKYPYSTTTQLVLTLVLVMELFKVGRQRQKVMGETATVSSTGRLAAGKVFYLNCRFVFRIQISPFIYRMCTVLYCKCTCRVLHESLSLRSTCS